jgi:hypothetical protein
MFTIIVAMLTAATSVIEPDVADYSIASIEYPIGPLQTVGRLQAGLLCLPKGSCGGVMSRGPMTKHWPTV